jgi:hypothetical protein
VTQERPRGLRWTEPNAGAAVLAPHWGHMVYAGFILGFNGVILEVVARNPQPGKHIPWYLALFLAALGVLLVGLFFFPIWGGQRLQFEDGVFRVRPRRFPGTTLSLGVAELQRFAFEPTGDGHMVVAVKKTGERVRLPLSFGNPLVTSSTRTGEGTKQERRREAEYIARRLDEMFDDAQSGHGTYRR